MSTITSKRFSMKQVPTVNGNATASTSQSEADQSQARQETIPSIIANFTDTVKKGHQVVVEPSTLSAILDAMKHVNAIDDRKMLLEHILVLLSKMPQGSLSTRLQNATVELLYNDLPHPPATYLDKKYQWRTADGSYNNVDVPDMGKAGMPYARSVQMSHPLPPNSLPDAGLVFDSLLRREGFVKHPAGLSSMMFSFAALVIHSVFRTSHSNQNINETSSYVDLAPLYGNNDEEHNKVRAHNGLGFLKPDVFAEDRLLLLPPAVCVLLVLFSRNHNFIAKRIFDINERGTYADPSTLDDDKRTAQDEEIFQTARLCNVGWFGSVVFSDYFSSILGLVRTGSSWSLNPFGEIRQEDHTLFERGRGNVCSVEFNCLYRWHATTSLQDEAWIEQLFGQLFKGKTPESVSVQDFMQMAKTMQAQEPDVEHWTFGNLKRGEDGYFRDEDLASVLHNATEHPAAAFRARGTPHVMRLHEIMGIEANRRWGVCSLNDFRKFLGLRPYASFKEWNPDPEIWPVAEKLYGHIDHLELYVGLQAEEAKPVVPGAGLCPGYTISRAILADAIALTRGDRFFTADYTPYNLTSWGFADCQRDSNGPGFGSMLGRLLLRTLPNNYSDNSIYTWFPLMTPDAMQENLQTLKKTKEYTFERPANRTPVRHVTTHGDIVRVLNDSDTFTSMYAERAEKIIKGPGFFVSLPGVAAAQKEQKEFVGALVPSQDAADKAGTFFHDTVVKLIKEHSYALVESSTMNVDIVRDVLKYAPLHWAAAEIAGIQLKTASDPHGAYTEAELYDVLGDIYSYLFLKVDLANNLVLLQKVKKNVNELLGHIKSSLDVGSSRFTVTGVVNTLSRIFLPSKKKTERHEMLERLYAIGHDTDHLANSILAVLVGSTVELTLVLTNIVNFLFDGERLKEITKLSQNTEPSAHETLRGYVWEAARLDPAFQGVFRTSAKDVQVGDLTVQKGDRLFLDIAAANLNDQVFSNPHEVNTSRSREQYLNGMAVIHALGDELASKIIAETVRAIFSLNNVRRGPGRSGQLSRFADLESPIIRHGYLDHLSVQGPWPTSMVIQYDAARPNGVPGPQ